VENIPLPDRQNIFWTCGKKIEQNFFKKVKCFLKAENEPARRRS
jgi:hypothetical protein